MLVRQCHSFPVVVRLCNHQISIFLHQCFVFQDVFTVSVGNLPPGAHVLIKITYVSELLVDREHICFTLPGSVAPWKRNKALEEITQVKRHHDSFLLQYVSWYLGILISWLFLIADGRGYRSNWGGRTKVSSGKADFSDSLPFWLDGLEEEIIARIKRIKASCFSIFVLSYQLDVCNEFMWMPNEAPSGEEAVFIFLLVLADTLKDKSGLRM